MTLTPIQQAISHILAPYFKHHEHYHNGELNPKDCPYCEGLDDLECYIQSKIERGNYEL